MIHGLVLTWFSSLPAGVCRHSDATKNCMCAFHYVNCPVVIFRLLALSRRAFGVVQVKEV